MSPSQPSVFLVEASRATRTLVGDRLQESSLVRVVGAAANLPAAGDGIVAARPDVVIIDSGSAPAAIAMGVRHPRFVLHATTVPSIPFIQLQRAGIHEVVFKEVGKLDELIAAVCRTAGGSLSS